MSEQFWQTLREGLKRLRKVGMLERLSVETPQKDNVQREGQEETSFTEKRSGISLV